MITYNTKIVIDYINKRNNDLIEAHIGPPRKLMYSSHDFAKEIGISKHILRAGLSVCNIPDLNAAYLISKKIGCKIKDLLIVTKW